ncbi:MAG: RNase adapter RapZ [Acidobacteriota bacterium]
MNPSHRTLIIVTGMSGAGKSQVIRTLEDAGFYCVERLPLELFSKFLELIEGAGGELGPLVALGLDLREEKLDERFPTLYDALKKSPLDVRILFVEASDDVLLRRFSETRRPHPLTPKGSVEEGIQLERARLELIRERSDWIVDTSSLTIHQLKTVIEDGLASLAGGRKLTVNLTSFGFAYGLPPEATLVFDVRFLPNPHFIPELRPLNGEDPAVFDFVCGSPEGKEFLERIESFLRYLVPRYQKEGKAYLTVAIGCTGGRHRSVAVARRLYDIFREEGGLLVNLHHRDRAR